MNDEVANISSGQLWVTEALMSGCIQCTYSDSTITEEWN